MEAESRLWSNWNHNKERHECDYSVSNVEMCTRIVTNLRLHSSGNSNINVLYIFNYEVYKIPKEVSLGAMVAMKKLLTSTILDLHKIPESEASDCERKPPANFGNGHIRFRTASGSFAVKQQRSEGAAVICLSRTAKLEDTWFGKKVRKGCMTVKHVFCCNSLENDKTSA